jgi:hypothetical protein
MSYIDPATVLSPKDGIRDLKVIYDTGPRPYSWSVAEFDWWGDGRVLGIRWNGEVNESSKGHPQVRGNATWFVLPDELRPAVLDVVKELKSKQREQLLSGYREMAKDQEREHAAEEWSEGLVQDVADNQTW